jgi:glycerophosphoryl diester phosphodiesterase
MPRHPLCIPGPPLVIGHRGAAAVRPENTIPSFAHALAVGVDAIEFDVRLARDGTVVVHHDPDTARTCGDRLVIAEATAADLRTLDAGATVAGQGRGAPARIPRLDEALELLRDLPLIIECKTADVTAPLIAALRRHALLGRVVVGSFRHDAMRIARAAGVATTASRTDMVAMCARAWTGVAPTRLPNAAFAIPERHGALPLPLARIAAMARPLGVPVHVWTVNDPADALRLWRAGVTGILSDDPAAMLVARARLG